MSKTLDGKTNMPDPDRKTISATESPALLGASPYLTRWMLWQKFANGIEAPRETNPRIEWGKWMQGLIQDVVARDRNLEVIPNDETYVRRGLLGCTRDATIISPDHGPGALEIKCVFDYEQWGRKWKGGAEVPREIEIQLQQQMLVGDGNSSGATYQFMNIDGPVGSSQPLVDSYKWGLIVVWVCADLYYFERKPVPELWNKLNDEAYDFFKIVHSRQEPDPFGVAVELPLLMQLFPTRPDSVLDLSADPDHIKTSQDVSMFKTMKEQATGSASVAEGLRIKLLALAKDYAFIKLPCGVSYRVKQSGKGKTIDPFVPDIPSAPPPSKEGSILHAG